MSNSAFLIDDLLVTCVKEIMSQGMLNSNLPQTIKDWMAGKLLSALPQRLVQKLLMFLLENRELDSLVSFKENLNGDEFTLVLGTQAHSASANHQSINLKYRNEDILEQQKLKSKLANDPTINFFSQGSETNGQTRLDLFADEVINMCPANINAKEDISTVFECLNCGTNSTSKTVKITKEPSYLLAKNKFSNEIATNGNENCNDNSFDDLNIQDRPHSPADSPSLNNTTEPPPAVSYRKPFSSELRRKFDCEICVASYRDKGSLLEHYTKYHTAHFNQNKDEILSRMKRKRDDTTFKKKGSKYRDFIETAEELTFNVNTGTFSCLACGKNFTKNHRNEQIYGHVMRIHRGVSSTSGKKTYKDCEICGKSFKAKREYDNHIAMHENRKDHNCNYCGQQYRKKAHLMDHKKKAHPEEDILEREAIVAERHVQKKSRIEKRKADNEALKLEKKNKKFKLRDPSPQPDSQSDVLFD